MPRIEYVLTSATKVDHWPGRLPYRCPDTRIGRGYRTEEDAATRARIVNDHYNRTHGCGLDLRIVAREVR